MPKKKVVAKSKKIKGWDTSATFRNPGGIGRKTPAKGGTFTAQDKKAVKKATKKKK